MRLRVHTRRAGREENGMLRVTSEQIRMLGGGPSEAA
jgi:hypothetical protein